jgi:hypothetical protein
MSLDIVGLNVVEDVGLVEGIGSRELGLKELL